MRNFIFKILFVFALANGAYFQTVTVNPGTSYQTFVGWDGTAQVGHEYNYSPPSTATPSFPSTTFPNYKTDLLNKVMDLGLNSVRLEMRYNDENSVGYDIGGGSTAVNDNSDPNSLNSSGIFFNRIDNFMTAFGNDWKSALQAQGEDLNVYICFVDFRSTGYQQESNSGEVAELIYATVDHFYNTYGYAPYAVEIILEPDRPNNAVTWTASLLATTINEVRARLDANSNYQSIKFIGPSLSTVSGNITWYSDIGTASSTARDAIDIVSYHRYGTSDSDTNIGTLTTAAQSHGASLGMTEGGADGSGAANHLQLYSDLNIGYNTLWQQFTIAVPNESDNGSQYFIVSSPYTSVSLGERTKYLRQYMKFIRPGAVRKGVTNSNSNYVGTPFVNPNGKYVVPIWCKAAGSYPQTITVSGLPAGTYGIKYTTGDGTSAPTAYDQNLTNQTITAGQNVSFSMPGQGVVTVYDINYLAPLFTTSPNALAINGQGDFVSIASPATTGSVTTFTQTGFFRIAGQSTPGYLIGDNDNGDIRTGSDGKLTARIFNGSETLTVTTTNAFDDNQWHSFSLVRNGTAVTFKVDNVTEGTGTFAANTTRSYKISFLGQKTTAQNLFKGTLRGIRLYSAALSDSELTTIHSNGWNAQFTDETNLVAGYNLDAGSGTTLADVSSNNKPGTINNPNSVFSNWINGSRTTPLTWYVSPTGSISNDGADSLSAWTLDFALSNPPAIFPGDTVQIADNSLFTPSAGLHSYLTGTSSNRITVRPASQYAYPPKVIIDGVNLVDSDSQVMEMLGKYTDYYGLRWLNSNPDRLTSIPGSQPTDIDTVAGCSIEGTNIRLINSMATNNSANGCTIFDPKGNVEVINYIALHNGWVGPDRAHSHGVYTHNATSSVAVTFTNFISLHPYYHPFQHFSSGGSDSYNYTMNGSIYQGYIFVISGGTVKHNFVFDKIFGYNGTIDFGQAAESNIDFAITNSILADSQPIRVRNWQSINVQFNKFIQKQTTSGALMNYNNTAGATRIINNNEYWRGRTGGTGPSTNDYFYVYDTNGANPTRYTFANWQALGWDANSIYNDQSNQSSATVPTVNHYGYLPMTEHRAFFAVFNWLNQSSVTVDMSQLGLTNGTNYTIYNLENPLVNFASFTYNAASPNVSVSMTSNGVLARTNDTTPTTTMPAFGSFMVVPSAQASVTVKHYFSSPN